jgi:hypothetical protein
MHVQRRDMCTGFLWGKTRKKRLLEILTHRWEDNLKIDLKETGWVWTGISRLRKGTTGRLLSTQ